LRVEREHACDDLVIGAGILPSSYASDLLDVARPISHAHAGAICMVDHAGTDARLRRILDATAPRRPTRARFTFAVHAVTLGCAVMLACTSSPPPPATRGTLSVGAPFVREPTGPDYPPSLRAPNTFGPSSQQGAIALPLVTAEITRRLGRLEACYDRRLALEPALSGTIEIHWVIAENGDVPESCITKDTVGDRELVDCVNQLVLEGGRFPAPRGGSVDVSFPFVFNPRNPHVAAAP
jgi:hypothetical protein